MKTEYRKPADLKPHPLNAEIYGDGSDKDLLDSVKKHGVMEPLLIKNDGTLISGHRRKNAADMARVNLVPVIVMEFEDELHEHEAVIHNNRQRVKTNDVIAREYKKLKEIEAERAKRRMEAGNNQYSPVVNLPQGTEGKARDLAAQKVGISGRTAEKAAKVVDYIDTLEEQGRKDEANEVKNTLNKSVDRAYKSIKKEKEPEKPKGSGKDATEAETFATIAISQLERIRQDDPLRVPALQRVQKWISNYLREIQNG